MKSEPSVWCRENQLDRGEQGEGWDGVRNYQASNNMKSMAIGDLAFFYHSVNEKQIVGIVGVCSLYQRPTDASARFGMVKVKAVKSLKIPVTLADIKADERLRDMALLRQPRLSVTPVTAKQWTIIMDKSQTNVSEGLAGVLIRSFGK